MTSDDLSEQGKTRLPRSVLSRKPIDSKYSLTADGGHEYAAEYINFAPLTVEESHSDTSQSLVRLHLPLPVINSFLPALELRSITVTSAPPRASSAAHISPDAPAPMTTALKTAPL